MNRDGSLVWWLVCIGLVLCWVWNFQSATETEPQELAALELDQSQVPQSEPTTQAVEPKLLPIISKRAEEVIAVPPMIEPAKVDASTQFLQASTPAPKPPTDLPFIDLSDEPTLAAPTKVTPLVPNSSSESLATTVTELPARQSLPQAQRQPLQPNNYDQKRVSNPYFNASPAQPEMVDPVLTKAEPQTTVNHFAQASLLDPDAPQPEHVDTHFPNFEDLEKEQSDWGTASTLSVTPANQFVSGTNESMDITPMLPAGQSLQLDPVTTQRCVNHIEYGKSLARRGAAFAAREEFFSALRLIAQSNDAQSRSTSYTLALRDAVTALNESDDFFKEIAHEGIDVDVAFVVDAHASKIIPMDRAQGLSSAIAIQAYFDFARRRMNDAFGENVVASEALYSLGKLFTVAATHDLTGNPLDYSKSIVMHYAAIDSDPKNYRSSNELGVLMARNGRLEKARDLFRDSLIVQKMPQTWRNLAIVHERIAKTSSDPQVASENFDLAQRAGHMYEQTQRNSGSIIPKVQWMTPEQFEQTAPAEFNEIRTAQALPEPAAAPLPNNKPGIFDRLKSIF